MATAHATATPTQSAARAARRKRAGRPSLAPPRLHSVKAIASRIAGSAKKAPARARRASVSAAAPIDIGQSADRRAPSSSSAAPHAPSVAPRDSLSVSPTKCCT
ncbi:MAG: hypothetical protein U0575_10150 [Phycisphaerales bacterium]